jgi:hypothetical protein
MGINLLGWNQNADNLGDVRNIFLWRSGENGFKKQKI